MKISITEVCKQRLEQRLKTPDREMDSIQVNFITKAFEQARNLQEIETDQTSKGSIDTLLNHEFVGYYLLALSSLDKNKQDCKLPRVVVWSDGSLNQSDIELLEQKVKGINIVPKMIFDRLITELGKSYRNLKTYSQTKFAKGRRYGMKLFIPYINPFSCDRILFLDSDYKFYKHPNVVFDFIHNKYSSEFIYNAESFDPNESLYQKGDFPWRMVDNQYVALYDERELQTISSIIGRTIKYAPELNTGLLGMTTQSLNPKTIDSLLGALYSMGYNDNTPRFDLMEQALFSFIVGMSSSYLSLPKDEYVCTSKTQGIHKKSIGRHFLGPSKFSVNYLE